MDKFDAYRERFERAVAAILLSRAQDQPTRQKKKGVPGRG